MRSIKLVLGACLIAATVLAQSPVEPPPSPTPSPNCLYASSSSGIYCNDQQTCCGYGTITPSCVDNGSDKQCCVHYKSAKQCNSTQTCCGALGPGASSYSFCCDEGSTCCQASVSYSGSASCCPSGSKCCRGGGLGFCCPSDQECNLNSYTCVAPGTTSAPTNAPAPVGTGAPAGSHRVCVSYSAAGVGIFYDITTDGSQTVMKRFDTSTNPPTLLDVNNYAALAMPNPAGSNWDVGVAFAATMQSRNVWMYSAESQTSAAHWDVLSEASDRWRFQTTMNGSPLEVTLATENCAGFNGGGSPPPAQATPQPPAAEPTTAAPQTAAPQTGAAGSHRVCVTYSAAGVGTYYEITADASQTVMRRFNTATNPPTLMDVNSYAALAMPNPAGSNFDVGVAFAATMQSRNVWMYPAESQTSAAFWDVLSETQDRWRFQTTQNGAPLEVTLATEDCQNF